MSLMDYLLAHMANMTEDHSDIMASALDEVAPKPKPKTSFKVVSTKTVKRNGKTYRVTVEELSGPRTRIPNTLSRLRKPTISTRT